MNDVDNTLGTDAIRVLRPTLESLGPSAIAAIRRIPPHDRNEVESTIARRPAGIFTDPSHYEQEQRAIFRRLPVPVGLSVQLPEPNMFLALNAYGLPILLSRTATGEVKAFLNVCQHKGSLLVERSDAFKAGRVSCPYHAWTFSATGKLVGVPRQEVFAGLRKEDHPLAELACKEAGGLIWVVLDRNVEPDFSHIHDDLVSDFEALNLPRLHLYGHKTFELDANWKLVLEPFLEPYHIQRLHANSVAGMFADLPNVVDVLGEHIRQVSGKADFEPSVLDKPGENIHKSVTFAYMVFPNTVVITSPHYISVKIVKPNGPAKSTVEYFMLTRTPPDNDKAKELYARSFELILDVFGNEDYHAACISQCGIESGAIRELTYGGMETNIPLFYEFVERRLAAAGA
ncbi:aromatic ring-hydroxylating oxygenase subunit alpha [Cupriavidus lacunae]|uniref:Aromatic ring-hydroxylating dioxygenase subunit alpha n=1 Tax=Cupriavidus lacunae TaxID=2666307 RepID=A0A370NWW8_9BURK|nr:aromatic ring-hydroxylating dioxygenase subunit alpha [Cupriavidus lacunae]RDK10101.1 aromatic ring-hydroxylating dioxygenase subunit alpha [Cupriavidus lacunae]